MKGLFYWLHCDKTIKASWHP